MTNIEEMNHEETEIVEENEIHIEGAVEAEVRREKEEEVVLLMNEEEIIKNAVEAEVEKDNQQQTHLQNFQVFMLAHQPIQVERQKYLLRKPIDSVLH